MLITRIKAKNFKTYLNLDLDISVEQDMPIILIGGANGGGKTTLFESIYGALYGLNIRNSKQFNELINAGATSSEDEKIILELHFTGKVLNEEHRYVLTRTYILNSNKEPVESVKLNLNGTIFSYGTATPISQRIEQEAQVNKIIKANLPQELSRYFLFDAMEAGNLLKEDQLNRVIKENIENVMGFNKYILLSKSAENLFQSFTAQKLQLENEKNEYSQLLTDKKKNEDIILQLQHSLNTAIQYSVANKELYDNLKSGLNQDTKISNKIDQTKSQIENIQKKENIFYSDVDNFIKDFELNVCLPKLLESINSELKLIFQIKNQQQENGDSNILPENIEAISAKIIKYLKENNLILKDITIAELVDYVLSTSKYDAGKDDYSFLEFSDTKALENLYNFRTNNIFPTLNHQKNELDVSINQIPTFLAQIQTMEEQITGSDYALLKAFEDNELSIQDYEKSINDLRAEISKIENKLHEYDIQTSQDPDPKYETLGKLKSFFEDVANQLLKVKKQQIEIKMKQDLNINLDAYRDVKRSYI